ncbi:MAG: SH3 domain-containing protein [Clostridia bacterium]|nr:SH3 domain-containing protein [Clostridia bacterium]
MKRLSILLALLMLLCSAAPALAGSDVKGVRYRVNITMPAGHDHIYLYDQPSSSNGKNLGRIDNGDYVTGISSIERGGYTWIFCNYDGIKGYIRKNNLVKVSGGSSSSGTSSSGSSSSSASSGMSSSAKNLSNFEYRRVASNGRGSLVFQKAPRGKSMSGHKFYDGDWIYVNVNYRKDGYSIAYENGEYGYVDASYIDWGSSSSYSGYSSSGRNVYARYGDTNVRTGPGLGYASLGTLFKGEGAVYQNEMRYDDRGVAWYRVRWAGQYGWVSSRYTEIG